MRGIASVRTSASFAFVLITVAVSAHTFSGFSARGRGLLLPSFLAGDEEVCSVGRTSLSKSLDGGEYAEAETPGVEAIQRAAPDIETSGAVLSEEEARFVKSSAKKYIVRFTSYKMQNEHKKTLERILGKKSGSSVTLADDEIDDTLTSNVRPVEHTILDRKNRAEAFPTDFALVTSRNEAALIASLAEPLARTLGVKDFFVDARLTRFPKSKESTSSDRSSDSDEGTHGDDDDDDNDDGVEEDNIHSSTFRRKGRRLRNRLHARNGRGQPISSAFNAESLWRQGFKGQRVKVGIFDTGVDSEHSHFKGRVKDRSNWTHENTLADGLGHGTFVAGVIASTFPQCSGFAPEADIHTFRVFTNDQVSYTSWFLDAFNYAIATEMHVINLSIGGPDYLDLPFVEKVNEITANGIIMVSAIGNDGPLYGTLNNPADMMDVIGVGGVNYERRIAPFSSRGMSTWDLPEGYGRVKPDIVAFGQDVFGSRISGGCRSLSGTSVASPVVAGAVTLLASVVPERERWLKLNPASMKQALVEGAVRLPEIPMYEQGAGLLNLESSAKILKEYVPRASLIPGNIDLTECKYAWPHCRQPIYHSMMPLIFNATIVNGMGVRGSLDAEPKFSPSSHDLGQHLDVRFAFSETLWPWSGYLAVYVRVKESGKQSQGKASGTISFTVVSPPAMGHDGIFETEIRSSTVVVPIIVKIIPTPAREKRILWDQFHNVRYPPGYVPRDNLDVKSDVLDWHGDHPHTNYHAMYDSLLDNGYFLEVLTGPFTCFDATLYASILIVDAEEEYSKEERKKLSNDVRTLGLGLIVFGEWYNVKTMHTMRFFDDNTHEWWTPVTGGANVPALNDLLGDFGFSFGDRIIEGIARIGRDNVRISSGANVMSAPKGAFVHSASMVDKAADAAAEQKTTHTQRTPPRRGVAADYAVCALSDVGSGRVFVFGDSNCLDSSHMVANCFNFLLSAVKYVSDTEKQKDSCPEPLCPTGAELHTAMTGIGHAPERRTDVAFKEFSATLGGKPGNIGTTKCSPSSPLNFHDAKSSYTTPSWMPTYKKSSLSSWSSLLSSKISDKIDSMSVSSNDGSTSGSRISSNSNRFARLNLQNNQNDEEKIRGLSVDQPAVVSSSSSSSPLRRSEQHHMRDETWVMGGIGALLGVFCIRIFRVRKRRRRLRGK